jgi:predicted nucleotidyltransferase
MAQSTQNKYLNTPKVKMKKYFYALRPLLSCMWVEKYNQAPPIEFDKLLESYTNIDSKLKEEILNLLEKKKL